MKITFLPLTSSHFPLLLEWLRTDHVRKWWDQDVDWTPALISQKYISYIEGFKLENGIKRPIHAYICYDYSMVPIGYIQYYNLNDFLHDTTLPVGISPKSAALDFYIGEVDYLRKGYGSAILNAFCEEVIFQDFEVCYVDPDLSNESAIKTYSAAGFEAFMQSETSLWMLKRK